MGRDMRKVHGIALTAAGMIALACSSGGLVTANPDAGGTKPSADGGLDCKDPGSRLFNGECRETCSAKSKCSDANETCVSVDDGEDVCLPSTEYKECSYLGDDTQCVASGGSYVYSRWGQTFVPYVSTYGADPSKTSGLVDPYFYGGGQAGPCAGDAEWITLPAVGPVACKAQHTVTRCRLTYGQCALVSGTTREFIQP